MSSALVRQNGVLTVGDVLLLELPHLSDEDREFVAWEFTGWPCFWNIPADGPSPVWCFRKQLREFREGRAKSLDELYEEARHA